MASVCPRSRHRWIFRHGTQHPFDSSRAVPRGQALRAYRPVFLRGIFICRRTFALNLSLAVLRRQLRGDNE